MEETKTTTPAWVEGMHKWQKENPNERAVLCIATDNENSINTLFGSSLKLTASLLVIMIQEPGYVDICKSALTAKENPIAALALISALQEAEKESGKATDEPDSKPEDSTIKESLKTILTKLADKL